MFVLLLAQIRSVSISTGTNTVSLYSQQTYEMSIPANTFVIFNGKYNSDLKGYATCGYQSLAILGSTFVVAVSFLESGTITVTNTLYSSQTFRYCAFTNRTSLCHEIIVPVGRDVTFKVQSGKQYCVYVPLISGSVNIPTAVSSIGSYNADGYADEYQTTYYDSHYFTVIEYSDANVGFEISDTSDTLNYYMSNENNYYYAYKISSSSTTLINTKSSSRDYSYNTPSPSDYHITKSSSSFPFWVLGPIFSLIVFVVIVVVCCVCSYKICNKAVKSKSSSSSSSKSKKRKNHKETNSVTVVTTTTQQPQQPQAAPQQPYNQNMQPMYYQPGYPTGPTPYYPPQYPSGEPNPYSADIQPNGQPAPYPNAYPNPYYPAPPQNT